MAREDELEIVMTGEEELERFLCLMLPSLPRRWRGADSREIEALQERIGRPLPETYVWFLGRMGHDTGPLRFAPPYPALVQPDFSIGAVRSCPHPTPYLSIGICPRDDVAWGSDINCLLADSGEPRGIYTAIRAGEISDGFSSYSSLREYLAWKAAKWPERLRELSKGSLQRESNEVTCLEHVRRTLEQLGFTSLTFTGPRRIILYKRNSVFQAKQAIDYLEPRAPLTPVVFRQPSSRTQEDEFLTRIDADPDDVATYLAYAGWLTERDDMRGLLVEEFAKIRALAAHDPLWRRYQTMMAELLEIDDVTEAWWHRFQPAPLHRSVLAWDQDTIIFTLHSADAKTNRDVLRGLYRLDSIVVTSLSYGEPPFGRHLVPPPA